MDLLRGRSRLGGSLPTFVCGDVGGEHGLACIDTYKCINIYIYIYINHITYIYIYI
jgi:hypothetical protein